MGLDNQAADDDDLDLSLEDEDDDARHANWAREQAEYELSDALDLIREGEVDQAVVILRSGELWYDRDELADRIVEEVLSLIGARLLEDAERRLATYVEPKFISEDECKERYEAAMAVKALMAVPPEEPRTLRQSELAL